MRLWFLFYLIIGSEANLNQWTSLPLEVLKSPKVDKYGFFGKQLDFIHSVIRRKSTPQLPQDLIDNIDPSAIDTYQTIKQALIRTSNVTLDDQEYLRLFASFTPILKVNQKCSNASWTYLWNAFLTNQLWAIRMFDATGKLPDGIFADTQDICSILELGGTSCDDIGLSFLKGLINIPVGNTHAYGSFEGCISVQSNILSNQSFNPFQLEEDMQGFYVPLKLLSTVDLSNGFLAETKMAPIIGTIGGSLAPIIATLLNSSYVSGDIEQMISVIQAIYFTTFDFQWAMCIPDACNEQDVLTNNAILYKPLNLTTALGFGNQGFTTETKRVPMDNYAVSIMVTFCILAFLVTLGTLVDMWQHINPFPTSEISQKSNFISSMLLAFSLYRNGKQVLDGSKNKNQLTCLHGIRVISMCWIIYGHIYMMGQLLGQFGYVDNRLTILNIIRGTEGWLYEIILNGVIAVDTFFFLSGLLVAYLTFIELEKGKLDWKLFYVHRYIRLTLPLAFAVAFVGAFPEFMSFGPLYDTAMKEKARTCREYGFRNLLYINNFYPEYDQCLDQVWYLACDMQFYILSPLIIYPLWKVPKLGLLFVGVIYGCLTVIIGYIVIAYQVPPNPAFPSNPNSFVFNTFQHFYAAPYVRFQPYLIGILVGYLLFRTKDKAVQIPHAFNLFLWEVSVATMVAVVFGLNWLRRNDGLTSPSWSNLESVIYNCFSKTAWSLALGWIVFSCHRGYGGLINDFLSWEAWIPLSKLTYCAYLNHVTIQLIVFLSMTSSIYFTDLLMVSIAILIVSTELLNFFVCFS